MMERIFLAALCLSGWNVSSCLPRQYHYVADPMTWTEAQAYCRETHTDLVTIESPEEMKQVDKTVLLSGLNSEVWIGLYSKILWKWSDNYTGKNIQSLTLPGAYHWFGLNKPLEFFWSDGSSSSFRYWDSVFNPLGLTKEECGVSDLERSGKWRLLPCESKFPFVCYSVPPPVKRHVIKLRMKPEDPSVDLNDPAVKADILRKLQDRLKKSGLSGVTLKWREQPDGKVFFKEGERSQKKKRKKSEL